MKKEPHLNNKFISKNRKANFQYEILEKTEAGIALKGVEVKSIRITGVNIAESYACLQNKELILLNMRIEPYSNRSVIDAKIDPIRPRKLLLKKKEIARFSSKVKEKGLTIVPLSLYSNFRGKIKIMLGLARGKNIVDKRKTIQAREKEREIRKIMKENH